MRAPCPRPVRFNIPPASSVLSVVSSDAARPAGHYRCAPRRSSMNKSTRTLALAAALASQALWGLSSAVAAPSAPALDQRVRESERKQQMIRTSTQRIGEDLAGIITEFENNGMRDGDDVEVRHAIHGDRSKH